MIVRKSVQRTGASTEVVREKRQGVLDAAYAAMPERFRKPPQAPQIPEVTWINRPEEAPIAI